MVDTSKKAKRPMEAIDARGIYGCGTGHYYINRRSIDVYGVNERGETACCRITLDQLKKAVALMERL
jgi:hypothetical protein